MITPTSWTGRTGFLASPPHSRGFLMEMSSGCSGGTFSKTFWFSLLPILNWTSPPNLTTNYTTTGFPREIKPCLGWSHSPGQTLLLRSQFPFSSSSHNTRLIQFNLLHHGHGYDLYIQGDPTPPGSDVYWEEVSLVSRLLTSLTPAGRGGSALLWDGGRHREDGEESRLATQGRDLESGSGRHRMLGIYGKSLASFGNTLRETECIIIPHWTVLIKDSRKFHCTALARV